MRLNAFVAVEPSAQLQTDITKLYQPYIDNELAIEKIYNKVLAASDEALYVATFNERHIAGLTFKIENSTAYIDNIAVRDITQTRGVGTYLIQQFIAYSKTQNCQIIEVGLTEKAKTLVSFLERFDFKKTEKKLILEL